MMLRLVVALSLIGALLGGVGSVPMASAGPPANDGSAYMATCLQSAHSLSALFLYDKSGSLEQTDTTGSRYAGLKVALKSLAGVKRADNAPIAIEAAVSAFDNDYYKASSVVNWTTLNDGSDDDRAKTIDDFVDKAKNTTAPQGGTHFTDAMQGAWSDIKDRGARGTCRVIFFFTDGDDEQNTIGGEPCRPGTGLLDQMRQAGIVIVGLQLGHPSDTLRAISTGISGSAQCGRDPIPPDSAGGVYIQADDDAALRRLFGTLGNLVRGCTPQGDRGGRIDPGVRSMAVTINTAAKLDSVRLDAPDGTVISARTTGSTTAGAYTTLAQSDDSYTSIQVDFPPGKGAGTWVVSAGQAITAQDMEFCVFSGLHLARIDPKNAPVAGGTTDIVYHAVDAAGNEANLDDYKDLALGASAVAATDDIRKTTAIRDGNHINVRVDTLPIDARLQVKLSAQPVTISDLALTPLAVDEGVGFMLSKEFPTVTPIDQLDLGTARKSKPAAAALTLLGSSEGPSKVCFDPATHVTVPDNPSGVRVDAPNGCIELARGETRVIQVSVTPITPTVGNGAAEIPLTLVPVAGTAMDGQKAAVNLPAIWRYEDPHSTPVLILVVVVASLLSVLLPLAALGMANFLTARFDIKGLRGEVIKVRIGPDGPRRVTPLLGAPDAVLDRNAMSVMTVSSRRRFTIDPVEFVSTRSLWPFTTATFSVKPTTTDLRVLSSVPPPTNDGKRAAANSGLGFLAVAVVAESDLANGSLAEVPATLVVLVRDPNVSSAELDPLMNSKVPWSVITDRWRSDVDIRAEATRMSSGDPDFSYLDKPSGSTCADDDYSYLDKDL